MSKRLIKIAKELNVGTTTLVDFLAKKGHEVENKPTAKISEEMYQELVSEFKGSMAVKEQADQLIIGVSRDREKSQDVVKAEPKPTPPPKETPKPVEEKVVVETPKEEVAPPKEVKPEVVVEAPKEAKKEEENPVAGVRGPKVVGKIDLEKTKKPKKVKKKPAEEPVKEEVKKEAKPEKVEKPVEKPVQEKVKKEAEPAPKKEEEKPAAPEKVIRADAPKLKGLKVLGKISTEKLNEEKNIKKKRDERAKEEREALKQKREKEREAGQKRKRKRRKIQPTDLRSKGGQRRNKKQPEVKEVSKKEIEEKIKATMAKMSGGGKNKRQKIRRDKRENIREKEELRQMEGAMDKKLEVTEFISVQELANIMEIPVTDVIMTCMNLGVIVSINQRLDAEIIELVADEYGHEISFVDVESELEIEDDYEDKEEDLRPRAPIVTVMGHVDHGKTSLLDYIRDASVADGEAGGITQHIGAYEVKVGADEKRITFLDTPGHEAFTAMRARGAKVTDVAVIIISADDKIMPQTKEAISHAQAAGVPIVFAINKIDKEGADPDRIRQELASMNLLVEDWGGKFQSQDISAKMGTNIDQLLEKIILEAELLELKANPNRPAIATVLEASLDKGRGYVTKILVQNGTLKIGDPIVSGAHSGRVKAMFNERGKRLKKAGPAVPVLVLGLSGAPQAGETFKALESEQEARQIAGKVAQIKREQTQRASKRISLDEIGRRLALGSFKELNLIVKGDFDGSVEALSDSLIKLSIESVQVNVIHKAVGQVVESDVLLASASDAIIIGFQVRPSQGARKLAEQEGVEIKTYSIIYEAIEQVKAAIEGMLEPTEEEVIDGQVDIREIFKVSKVGTVAGCFVSEGTISRNSLIRVIREGIVVYPTKQGVSGEIGTLKRFKDDVKEVKSGMECGLTVKNFNDIKVGDVIEAYHIKSVKQTL